MPPTVKFILVFAYLWWAIELAFFHVPSVASNMNIWRKPKILSDVHSPSFQKLFLLPLFLRVLLFGSSLIAIYFTFLIPLLPIFSSANISRSYVLAPTTFSYALGGLLILVGRTLTFYSVFTIRKDNPQKDGSFKLHTDEVFQLSRNPGLLGMYLFLTGLIVTVPSIYLIVGGVIYFAHMHFKVLMEEDFLTCKFGGAYEQYKRSTGRYWS